MASSGRLLALLVLLACMVQLYECFKIPGISKTKTEEEKAEEELLKKAKIAYKRMFVWSDKLSTEQILEDVKALAHFKGRFDYDLDIDELMEIQEPKEELCDSRAHVERLKYLVKATKRKYKALHEWVMGALNKQLELCNYGQRFANKLEQFKAEHPDQWKLVEDFNYFAGRNGVRQYDWKGKFIDNSHQMNDAMVDMFEDQVYRGYYKDKTDMTYRAYYMAVHLREACEGFGNAVGAVLLMNTFSPTIKQDQEKLEWLRYLNVCDQAARVDFAKAIHRMFHDTGYLKQDGWNSYLEYRELWV